MGRSRRDEEPPAHAPALARVAAQHPSALQRRLAERAAVALQREPRLVIQVRVARHFDDEREVETSRDAAARSEVVVVRGRERAAVEGAAAHVVVR